MRVANIIIAHKNPDQLVDLIKQFPDDQFHNWVHIDTRSQIKDFKELTTLKNVTLLPRMRVVWAGYSFVKVTVEALRLIRKSRENFSYFNLMSGMDFPIRPTSEFYQFLSKSFNSDKQEYFQIAQLDENWPAHHRYQQYHLSDWTIKGRYFTERIINKFVGKRQFYNGKLIPYGRSAWFTATSDFVDYSLKFFDKNPDYLRFLKSVWCPDELAFSSLIMGSPFKEHVSEGNLRYIDWSEGNANPKTIKLEDFDSLVNSKKFLARKFDIQVDKQVLEKLKIVISH